MDRLQQRPSQYYETDRVFHNNFLEVLEDCIVEKDSHKSHQPYLDHIALLIDLPEVCSSWP